MEMKKSKKAQLGSKNGLYFNIGLVLALAFVISAFEWKSYGDVGLITLDIIVDDDDWYDVPATFDPPPKPPKPKPQLKLIEIDEDDLIDDVKFDFDINPDDIIPDNVPEPEDEKLDDQPFLWVENMPKYPGGLSAFYAYVGKEMKYPTQARKMGVEGKVFIEFIIDKSGALTKVKVIKGIGAGCDKEALRVIKNSPPWLPGKQRGIPVKVKKIIPIVFELRN